MRGEESKHPCCPPNFACKCVNKKRQFAKPWTQSLDLPSYNNAYIYVYMIIDTLLIPNLCH